MESGELLGGTSRAMGEWMRPTGSRWILELLVVRRKEQAEHEAGGERNTKFVKNAISDRELEE